MHRLFALFPVLLLLSCSGSDDGETFLRPETCDDGVDNNDNGLVDCDDTAFCGGLQCNSGDDDDDTTVPPPPLEIQFDPSQCCDFEFAAGDCPKSIGTFGIINRSTADAVVDTSCDLVAGNSPIQWQVVGGDAPVPFLVNAPLYAESSMTVEGFFNCDVNQAFTTPCRIKVETDEELANHEFDTSGTPTP